MADVTILCSTWGLRTIIGNKRWTSGEGTGTGTGYNGKGTGDRSPGTEERKQGTRDRGQWTVDIGRRTEDSLQGTGVSVAREHGIVDRE